MGTPQNPAQFECMLSRLIEKGAFDSAGSRQDFRLALQEVVRAIQAAHFVQTSPSACERLVASLLIRALEQTSSSQASQIVTLSDADPEGS